ncbi:TPA: hypothetical protein N0F65_001707 [Lagenidium giganteum]|uniref:Replicase-associated protein n=1 Tax=Lagenidium giganteum TaxID=4803 RepID=A0AAV2YJB9_9STRA|nr:TPA: hypothetical protein N0F65_001707 [Lagenidium giganteum]
MIILGPRFSGKNNLVFYILKNSPNVFSHLHIIARNPNQELYNYINKKLKGFCTIYESDAPPNIDSIRKSKDDSIEHVIINDYSNDQVLHKMIRLNSEYVAFFKANSKGDLKMLLKDFNIPNINEDKLYRAYKIATENKGQCHILDSVKGELQYKFNKGVDPSTL